MKKIIFLFFLIYWNSHAQERLLLEGSYLGGLKPKSFSIIPVGAIYKINKNIGVGLSYVPVRGGEGSEKESHISPRIEYTFGKLKMRPYIALAASRSSFEKSGVKKDNLWQMKAAFGVRYHLTKNMFLKGEASNYRYDAGFSVWPTLGLGVAL